MAEPTPAASFEVTLHVEADLYSVGFYIYGPNTKSIPGGGAQKCGSSFNNRM